MSLRSLTAYTKKEVLTRQWHDGSGTVMALLDFHVEKTEGAHRLAIVKYGDRITARVYCVDIYESRRTLNPSEDTFFLVCHDTRNGWVTNLEIERKDVRLFFNFQREYINPDNFKTIRNTYSYRYEIKAGLSETTGDFYQELSR